MKKRFLSILLALCMVTQFVPTAALAAQPDAVSNGTTTAMSTTETEQGPDQVADDGEDGTADNEGQTLNDEAIEDSTGGDGDSETALHNEEAINAVAEPGDGDNGTTGDGEETADALADCDFSVTGDASNYTWDEATGVLTITGGAVEVSNKDADAATSQRIYIQGTAHVTLAGVNIVSSAGAPIEIQDYGDTSVTLALEGANTLVSQAAEKAALHKSRGQQADGSQASTLTINGTGSLTATGGDTAAGIGGGGYHGDVHNITIDGGTISATGTGSGAGIGASYGGSTWNIVINGGNVTANGQPGIGASNWNGVRNANIAGGMVVANSYEGSTPTGGLVSTDSGKSYILRGDYTLSQDLTIASDGSLTVAEGAKLTVAEGATLTNEGTLTNDGTIDGSVVNEGTLVNDGAIAGPLVNDGSVYSKGTLPADMSGTGTVYRQHVTVNGGTGSGNYDAGSPVTITADAPEDGKMFTGWTVELGGVALADSSQAQTTFTMPDGCAIVTANYAEVVAAVTDASGNTTYYGDSYAAREAWRSSGGTLTVYSDSFEFSGYSDLIPSNGVLDLNGHSISSFYLSASNGTITIKNGTLKDRVFCSIFSGARVTFEDVAIERGDQTLPYGLYIYNEGTIISNGLALENGITIEGSGSVTGDVKTALTDSMFTLDGIPDEGFVFDGTSHVPSVKCGDATLTENTDYTVTLSNSTGGDSAVNAGTVTVKITGTGSYGGTVTKTYEIAKQSIDPGTDLESPNSAYKGVTISDPSNVVYNGTEQKWAPEVKDAGDAALVADRDYTVTYSDDVTNVGTVTATVQGIGNYTGTVTKNYEITNHGHKICGEKGCANDKHGDELPWTAWTDTANLPNIPGNYYLADNVTLTATWTCNVDINLCLNGHTIYGANEMGVISIESGELDITDCHSGDAAGKITHKSDDTGYGVCNASTFSLWNGSVTGNSSTSIGGVWNNRGTFTMYGGSITDNKAGYGGGVSNDNGTFTMAGGSVTGNTADGEGGGVYNYGTINLSGVAVIKDNTANGAANNLYLCSGKTITVENSKTMDPAAEVYITGTLDQTVVTGTTETTGFYCDNAGYKLEPLTEGGATGLKLVKNIQTHCVCGSSTSCGDSHSPDTTWQPWDGADGTLSYNNDNTAYVYLTQDVTRSDTFTVVDDQTLYLCLNGKTFTTTAEWKFNFNYAINVAEGGKLIVTDCQEGVGTIQAADVYASKLISSSGSFTLWNGNVTSGTGVGVNSSGTLTMNGGSITNCAGGGVSSSGTFIMNGGSIESCGARGVYNAGGGAFTMNGGSIIKCGGGSYGNGAGGGVYNTDGGTFTMNGGEIVECSASSQGGGVFNGENCTFTMESGSRIINCGGWECSGGGVGNQGTFNMNGGDITECHADAQGCGGGVNSSGTFNLSGGSITNNKVSRSKWIVGRGGGVYNYGTFNISGNPVIKDNDSLNSTDNVYLNNDKTITVENGKSMGSAAEVYIAGKENQTVVTGTTKTTGFCCDNEDYRLVDNGDGGLKIVQVQAHCVCGDKSCEKTDGGHSGKIEWTKWESADSLPTDAGNYFLAQNVALADAWTVSDNINLCLNGKTITGADEADVIKVNEGASLTITDCQYGFGAITHGENATGRGIYNQGTLTLWNGRITGNTTSDVGGGVWNNGTFAMGGGSIASNTAKSNGGGVFNGPSGTFTMFGGSVFDNSAETNGGGVFNHNTFTMSGGSIVDNKAATLGGGVCNYAAVNLSGNVTITRNAVSGAANNVYLASGGKKITVAEGATLAGASVGIIHANPDNGDTVVSGLTDTEVFSSDDANYELVGDGNGGLKLSAKPVTITGVNLLVSSGGDEMTVDKTGARSKVYDGLAVVYDASKVAVEPDTVTGWEPLSYTWQEATVTGGVATYTDLDAAPSDVGSYRLLVTAKRGEVELGSTKLPFTIAAKPLTVNATAEDKTYDGGTAATLKSATLDGVLDADESVVLLDSGKVTVAFEDKSAGDSKAVTATVADGALSGGKAGNYTIATATAANAKISPKTLTATIKANDKTYDGTAGTTIESVSLGGVVSGDDVKVDQGKTATFDSAAAGDDKTVTVTGLALSGDDAGNYTPPEKVTCTGKITPAPLTVSTPSASKVYDGSALTAAATADNISGLVNNETAAVVANGSQTDAGSSENGYVIEWGTAKESNYHIQSENKGTLTVTAKPIVPDPEGKGSMTVNDPSDVTYDGQEHKWVPVVKDGDKVLVEGTDYEISYNNRTDFTNVDGTIAVTITGKGNYSGSFDRTYQINKAQLSVVTESGSKSYDGQALTADGAIDGFVNGESAAFKVTGSQTTVGSSTNTYTIDWNAADSTAKASNYTIEEELGELEVTPNTAAIYVVTTGATKVYDGTALEGRDTTAMVMGVPNGFTSSYTLKGSQTDKGQSYVEVDTFKIFNAAGDDVTSNFSGINTEFKGSLSVMARPVTLTSASASKVYDGTELTAHAATASATAEGTGMVAGQTFDLEFFGSQTAEGSSENTFVAKSSSTADVNNYSITYTNGTLTVGKQAITPGTDPENPDPAYKGIKISDPESVVYDASEHKWSPEVTDKDGNKLVEGTDYEVSYSTADFTNATGTITVTITGKGNYSGTVTKTYEITKRPVTISNLVIAEKYYDGTDKASFMATPVLVGVVGDDKVTLVNGVPTFTSVSVGLNIPISFTEFKLDGAGAGNYTLTQPTGIKGDISAYIPSSKEYVTTTTEWTNQDFVVTASSGWLVSETNTADGTWSESLTRSTETGSTGDSLTFYVKNKNRGFISEAITKTYRIDKTAPAITGAQAGKTYCGPVELTVDDANLDTVTVDGKPVEPAADEAMALAAEAPAGFTFTVQPAEGEQTVVATDMAGNTTTLKLTVNDGHTWGAWSSNGDGTHTHACEYDDFTETADCHGGTATCSDRAVCDDCGQSYGEVDASNHAALTHVEATAATATAEGNIEYWHCEACGRYFADAAGEKEIQQADTVVAKKAEAPDGSKGDSTASKTDGDEAGGEEPGKSQVSRTGDSTAAAWPPAILGAAALAAVLVSARRRRS